MIKLFDPYYDQDEEEAVSEVLESHFWASGSGTGKVAEFENEFKKYTGSSDCVTLNSGTAALHLALLQVGIEGKEVLVPSLTFVSTVSMISYSGGKPVFVDVDENTLCIDIEDAKNKINSKTAVILPVHFGGYPSELSKLSELSNNHKISLIEDAAHACGSTFGGKKIGSHSEMVCFSFHPVKNLAMPTGGAITLNGELSSKRKSIIKSQRWCGIDDRDGPFYDIPRIGWNYYMNEFSAAIGLVQLKRLNQVNNKRRKIAKIYYSEIGIENKMPFNKDCSYHMYWIRVKNRKKFMKKMKVLEIETGVHYNPIHKMSFYDEKSNLPITEQVGREIVSIPIHPNLSDQDIDFIVKKINQLV